MTIHELLQHAKEKLIHITDQPLLEAEVLLSFTLQKPRSYVRAWGEKNIAAQTEKIFLDYVARRVLHEPIAYITGHREFWSLDFAVNRDTLIPRPETELLVETILDIFAMQKQLKIADLGTGSGAIALALAKEKPQWQVVATDNHQQALMLASKNAQQFKLKNISFYHGNWCTALPANDFDVIVSNPPYLSETEWPVYATSLAFEPRAALVSGQDGLNDLHHIILTAKQYLKAGGYLFLEHGFTQAKRVRQFFLNEDYIHLQTLRDLSDRERVTYGICNFSANVGKV